VCLDRYARDFALWRGWAAIDYSAAKALFQAEHYLRMALTQVEQENVKTKSE
jgi:hypothetical protein